MPKDIIRYMHKNNTICIRRYWNRTELLFNEQTAAAKKGILETSYALQGELDADFVVADVRMGMVGAQVRLIINGLVVDQAWKA